MTAPMTSREALLPCPLCTSTSLCQFTHSSFCDDGWRNVDKIMCADCQCEAPLAAWNARAGAAQALPPGFGTIPNPEAVRKANHGIGKWLSAASDDPAVCGAMKSDINAWFEAHEPWPEIASPMPSTMLCPRCSSGNVTVDRARKPFTGSLICEACSYVGPVTNPNYPPVSSKNRGGE